MEPFFQTVLESPRHIPPAVWISFGAAFSLMWGVKVVRWLLSKPETFPYGVIPSLLTETERHFAEALFDAVDELETTVPTCYVAIKPRLADVFQTEVTGGGRGEYIRHFARISQKHVDFLICDGETFQPLAGVELDDPSHERPDRVRRDALVEAVFEAAGLPLVRVPTARRYSVKELQRRLQPHLSGSRASLAPVSPAG